MKTKYVALAVSVLMIFSLLTGCSSATSDFKAVVSKGTETVSTITENTENELKKIMLSDGTPLFKSVEIKESNGLFYNSYTFKATTNIDAKGKDSYIVTVTMPGNITQTKDGVVKDNIVTFTIENFNQENELAAYSDSNNITAVIVILVILVAVLGAFIYFTKRKEG